MTNLECVTDLITFSQYGALAQAFIMDALSKHASHIAKMPLEELTEKFGDRPVVGAKAWHGVANEIHDKLEAHFARWPIWPRQRQSAITYLFGGPPCSRVSF